MFQFQTGPRAFRIIVDESHLDASNAYQFRCEFDAHCPDIIHFVDIDFTRVELIDSSGIAALLNIRKRIHLPIPVALRNSCPSVRGILQTMRLHRVFQLDDSLPAQAHNNCFDLDQQNASIC